ncbi:hypothetical protein E1J38_010860 [Seonamhaeicola sediminis]|uniref:LamG domain-containing protein n=1 Tax=Seonamhaeicola sediminis TaxID=2528206 RepID=A0A562YCV4_9FLAO|nr:hypothetical protein [Seonamhaeicola sediminis]TWO31879.1 hypothetical protein E1J38_010860 [Seonamhaeicola sediminis]
MKLYFVVLLALVFCLKLNAQADIPNNYKLVYAQDFEQPQAIIDLEMTDPDAWRIGKGDNDNCMELFKQSEYKPVVRSPFNIAMIKDILVGDFIFEIRLNQNGREYGHRDLCLMFGINNPSNFYYTHIASKSDAHANSIFIVNDAPRVSIVSERTDGTNWGAMDSWHTVRVVRKVEDGIIEIYFDDMSKPIMKAVDTHFKSGYLGFGSFDDTGKFDDIKVWAPNALKPKTGFFN